jgi:Ran GTPase-activating protein (RanGAP) involved in mRNA processing and transport
MTTSFFGVPGVIPRYKGLVDELTKAGGTQKVARFGFKSLGEEGAALVAGMLSSGTARSLEGLELSCNNIGTAGGAAIGRSLAGTPPRYFHLLLATATVGPMLTRTCWAGNGVLRSLDISTNGIGDDGAIAIAESLKINAALTSLDLHACSIGDKGATALADMLADNFTLETLNLKANYINDAGAIALAKAAAKSRGLRCLMTSSNDIEDEGKEALQDAFNQNDRLTEYPSFRPNI